MAYLFSVLRLDQWKWIKRAHRAPSVLGTGGQLDYGYVTFLKCFEGRGPCWVAYELPA